MNLEQAKGIFLSLVDERGAEHGTAFTLSAVADWIVYTYLRDRPWLVRSNGSNVVGAAVDSLIFPTLAFGAFLPHIVAMQFAAKVGGGAVWSWLLRKRMVAV